MSRHIGKLYHPGNGHAVDVYEGFSWPCFFAGCFWFLVKGMVLMALVSFFIAFVTFGLSWLIFPFLANKMHYDHLRKEGYLTAEQAGERSLLTASG